MENKNIESILIFNVRESLLNNSITIDIQSFPKYSNKIKSYEMVFDMKFREDYVSDSNICIGPLWDEFGSGEFSIQLLKADNFKNLVGDDAKFNADKMIKIFKGEDNDFSKAVCLNAAAGLIVGEKFSDFSEAYNYTREFILSGKTFLHLEKIQNV